MRDPNKKLRCIFDSINEQFFDGRLPENTTVKYAKIKDDGQYKFRNGTHAISVHEDLAGHPDLSAIILIHEMIHEDLRLSGYIGYDFHGGHSQLFYAAVHRLYNAGCYETLL